MMLWLRMRESGPKLPDHTRGTPTSPAGHRGNDASPSRIVQRRSGTSRSEWPSRRLRGAAGSRCSVTGAGLAWGSSLGLLCQAGCAGWLAAGRAR